MATVACTKDEVQSENFILERELIKKELIERSTEVYRILGNTDSKLRKEAFQSKDFDKVKQGKIDFREFLTKNFNIESKLFTDFDDKVDVFISNYGIENYIDILDDYVLEKNNRLKSDCNCGQDVFDSIFGSIALGGSVGGCLLGNVLGCVSVAWTWHNEGFDTIADAWDRTIECECWSNNESSYN